MPEEIDPETIGAIKQCCKQPPTTIDDKIQHCKPQSKAIGGTKHAVNFH